MSITAPSDPHIDTEEPVAARSGIRDLWSPWTLAVGTVGVVLRVIILRSPSGVLLADEAYTGLASMAVFEDGRFPIVLDGNRYTAVLEVYAYAPVVAVVGSSIVALKILPMVMWAAASVFTYLAAVALAGPMTDGDASDHRMGGRRIGAVAASIVWIAPGALLVVSTLAYPGYALGMAVSVASLVVAILLIDLDEAAFRRSLAFGALVGLGFYLHPMFLAVLVPMVLPVAWQHRGAVANFWVPFVAAGVFVNIPFLAWNAANDFASLEVQNGLPGSYGDRLHAFATELIPRGYGLRDDSLEWLFGPVGGPIAYGAIVLVVAAGCAAMIRHGERRSRWLIPIVVLAAWPLMACLSPLIYSTDGRYNVITFPFVALAAASSLSLVRLGGRRATGAAVAFVAVWSCVTVWPHTDRIAGGGFVDANAETREVVEFLESAGIEFVAGSFWTVLPIEFLSDREIVGAVVAPFPIRFPERQREVEGSPPEDVAFVFPSWADEPGALWMPLDQYERVEVAGTVIYVPIASS